MEVESSVTSAAAAGDGVSEEVGEIDSTLISIYNELEDEVQGIFLLCGVYGKSILVNDLLKYAIGLGVFKHMNSIGDARQEFEKIIGKLKESSLVLEHDEGEIQMDDHLRDFAKSIASSNRVFTMERTVPLKDWTRDEFLRGCSQIILEGNHLKTLPERLDCPKLELLRLDSTGNRTLKIPDSFFEGMENLQVLDLVGMVMQPELPTSLVFLTKLKTLCLNACSLGYVTGISALRGLEILSFFESSIKEFPIEIGQLTHLKMLDLSYFKIDDDDKVILPNILSNLTKLEELCVGKLNKLEEICFDQLIIDSLQKIKVIIKLKRSDRLEYLFSVSKIKNFSQPVEIEVSECSSMKNIVLLDSGTTIDEIESIPVHSLTLQHLPAINGFCSVSNFGSHDVPTLFPNKKALFHPLRHLKLISISRIMLLVITALSNRMIPLQNLETMEIVDCNDLQYLFVIEGLKMHENYCGLLPYLRRLHLRNLGKLRSILGLNHPGRALSFTMLRYLKVCGCNKLKYVLPFYVLQNLQQLENIEISDCKMLETVFGDDEEVRQMRDLSYEARIKNNFQMPQVKSLILENLPKFRGCGQDGTIVEWLSLERLRIVKCSNLHKSCLGKIDRSLLMTSVEVIDCNILVNKEDLESIIEHLFELKEDLFNGLKHLKVIGMHGCNDLEYLFTNGGLKMHENNDGLLLPDLRQLHLHRLDKFRSIVDHNLAIPLGFKMLNQLVVHRCDQLRCVLPLYLLDELYRLQNIEISDCAMLERIFGDENGIPVMKLDRPNRLHKVKSLILENLPKFKECCHYGCEVEWLSLKRVRVVKCPKIQEKSLGMIERPLLKLVEVIGCDPWANNEDQEINIAHLFELTDEISRCEILKIKDSEELKKYIAIVLQPLPLRSLKILEATQCDHELNKFLSILLRQPHQLEKLTVANSELLEQVFNLRDLASSNTQVAQIFPNLHTMILFDLPKLNYICDNDPIISGTVKLGNLGTLEIVTCSSLKGPLPAALLEKLVKLKIESCKIIEQVVEENAEMQDRLFHKLKNLELVSLPNMTKFNSGHCNLIFPNLRSLRIEKCPRINELTTNEGTSNQVPLDENMGRFSNIADRHKLKEVDVDSFSSLRYIFPSTMLPMLSEKLETLILRSCTLMGSSSNVFQLRENHSITSFQKLGIVRLKGFQSLQSLLVPCNYPSLKEIDISDCENLEDVFIDTGKEVDEKCFPNLEKIVLENLPMLSSFSLELFEFPKLQEVRIVNCPEIQTFLSTVSSKAKSFMDTDSCENRAVGHGRTILIPQLTKLELSDLPKMQLWNQEPQIPVFGKLTSLKIIGCGGIEKLFSISMAKNLSSLESLTLYKCENMVCVLRGSGETSERVFQKLKRLVFKHLPELTCFCEEDVDFGEFQELNMVRVEHVPKMVTFVKQPLINTPNLKEIYVTYVNKLWRGDLNNTITYLHKIHYEKLEKEVWKADKSSPGDESFNCYADTPESTSKGMTRTSWSFEEVETKLH